MFFFVVGFENKCKSYEIMRYNNSDFVSSKGVSCIYFFFVSFKNLLNVEGIGRDLR